MSLTARRSRSRFLAKGLPAKQANACATFSAAALASHDGGGGGTRARASASSQSTARTWSVPLIISPSMPVGEFLVGAFAQCCVLFVRQLLVVEIAFENEDDFVRNMACLRAEERVALAVPVPAGLVKGTFGGVAATRNATAEEVDCAYLAGVAEPRVRRAERFSMAGGLLPITILIGVQNRREGFFGSGTVTPEYPIQVGKSSGKYESSTPDSELPRNLLISIPATCSSRFTGREKETSTPTSGRITRHPNPAYDRVSKPALSSADASDCANFSVSNRLHSSSSKTKTSSGMGPSFERLAAMASTCFADSCRAVKDDLILKPSSRSSSTSLVREAIICPDVEFVFTRQTSSTASAAIRTSVDIFPSRLFRASSPPVSQFVKSATYSPTTPRMTKSTATYSAYSHRASIVSENVISASLVLFVAKHTKCLIWETP
jgi:hypothetical protein